MAKEHTKIEDYGFLSDTQTGALVSRDGCVDWLCFPRFDSPACFASLLGEKENGHWRFFPKEKVEATRRRYRGETLILETEIETKSGAIRLIDFMPPRGENPDIVRIIEGVRGRLCLRGLNLTKIRREKYTPTTHCGIRKRSGRIGRNNFKPKGNGAMRSCAH